MKAKFSKSALSVILALVMVISMITVGIVSATSAKVEIAEASAANLLEIWFTRPSSWTNIPNVHFWGGNTATSWPGQAMTYKYDNDFGQKVYYTTIDGTSKYIIFNNGAGSYQTVDTSVSGKVVAYYVSGNETSSSATVKSWDRIPDPLIVITYSLVIDGGTPVDVTSGTATVTLTAGTHTFIVNETQGSSTQPVKNGAFTAAEAGTYKVTFNSGNYACTFTKVVPSKVYFTDNTNGKWIAGDEAVITANGTVMTKTVDEHTGWTVWTASIAVDPNESIAYKRVSKLDNSKVWNTWNTTYDANNPCYVASGYDNTSNTGEGANGTAPTIPEGTVTDYWYGIWADPKGNGNIKDFIKIYAADLYGSTDYYLYLPSYANRSALTIYTSLYELKIGSTPVPRATAATVNLSSNNAYNLSYKRYETDSVHDNFKLHVVSTTGTSALLLTTKADLYTGTTAAYAVKEDDPTVPDFPLIAKYKESTSTKGDYLCYDSTGNLLNPVDKETGETLTGLKKIKGRGNSTFEASMRLYGKYAYNITLNDKAKLIPDCESQKKYSLLANNADETLLRNVTVYGIADQIGMPYTPNTRLVDMYDNGNYIGAYVLTEKVEYGKNTLIPTATSSDKMNEDILAVGKGIDYDSLKQVKGTYTAKSGTKYQYQYNAASEAGKTYEYDGTEVTIGEGEEAKTYTLDETYMKKGDFLLEHEIDARYDREATWFISGRTGQAVVPKYPEFATQKQVQWMIEEYDALETAVFAKNYTTVSQLADVETFADVYLIQELTMNLDAAATSYNILGGGSYEKLIAAPLWDYDWAAGQYNGEKLTTDGKVDVADTSKVFVKKKSVKIDSSDGRTQSIPNLQAKMTEMTDFWTLCKKEWTNDFKHVLDSYLGDGKTLLGTSLPAYRSAAAMNESRWGSLQKNYNGARSTDPMAATWGTRSTTAYNKGSNSFGVGAFFASGSAFSYDNTVYYLNDWLTQRSEFMSKSTSLGGMGLYDQTLYVEPTEPPTEAPTDPPTEAPTAAPTDAPTEAPTTAPVTYLLGDADGDGDITIMDATAIQRRLVGYSVKDPLGVDLRGCIVEDSLSIVDATAIQRKLVGYSDKYGIGTEKTV